MYKNKIVKSYRDANELIQRGFICNRIDKDRYNSKRLIFFFENTKELNEALNSISQEYKTNSL
jgi:hypothetical protein